MHLIRALCRCRPADDDSGHCVPAQLEKIKVPFPNVCADCPHDECIALVNAWKLLQDDFDKQ